MLFLWFPSLFINRFTRKESTPLFLTVRNWNYYFIRFLGIGMFHLWNLIFLSNWFVHECHLANIKVGISHNCLFTIWSGSAARDFQMVSLVNIFQRCMKSKPTDLIKFWGRLLSSIGIRISNLAFENFSFSGTEKRIAQFSSHKWKYLIFISSGFLG